MAIKYFVISLICGFVGLMCWGAQLVNQNIETGVKAILTYFGIMLLVPTSFFVKYALDTLIYNMRD